MKKMDAGKGEKSKEKSWKTTAHERPMKKNEHSQEK
jgi:hypothetical protein